jgi:hypothetical protein
VSFVVKTKAPPRSQPGVLILPGIRREWLCRGFAVFVILTDIDVKFKDKEKLKCMQTKSHDIFRSIEINILRKIAVINFSPFSAIAFD